MATTLPFQRILPTDGDRGSEWFDALESNISINDAHTHDGVTSPLIPASNISKATQAISSGSWVLVSGGTYSQTVSMPSGVTMANAVFTFRETATGHVIHPTIEQVTANSYEIFINDNTLDLTVTYG